MTRRFAGAVAALFFLLPISAGARDGELKTSGPFEVTSRLGRRLYALPDSDGAIAAARHALSADPKNATLIVKLSKAQAAKRQYREAIVTCTNGIKYSPANAELYLERGHRELGLRDFRPALADLSKAVDLDASLLEAQYHLGMAHYFLREYDEAAKSFGKGLALAKNNDSVIDCSNWLYVSLRRAGKTQDAANVLKRITPEVKNKEPHLYFYLRLLRFYQGIITEKELLPPPPAGPNDVEAELSFNTINYGVGNWHVYTKTDPARAREFFSRVVKGSAWNSWGFIGSELEMARP